MGGYTCRIGRQLDGWVGVWVGGWVGVVMVV